MATRDPGLRRPANPLAPNDDEAGGQLIFNFNSPVLIESVDLLDINAAGGTIKLFDASGRLLSTKIIPALGENTFQTVFVKGQLNGSPFEASRMVVTLSGDGAISKLVYTDVNPVREYSINHRYVEESAPGAPHHVTVTDPGQQFEGGRVRHGQHVGLLRPGEAVDHGPVEHEAVLEGLVQLGRGDRERLEEALDVGEPEPHEADVPLLDRAQHRLLLGAHDGHLARRAEVVPAARSAQRSHCPLTLCSHLAPILTSA